MPRVYAFKQRLFVSCRWNWKWVLAYKTILFQTVDISLCSLNQIIENKSNCWNYIPFRDWHVIENAFKLTPQPSHTMHVQIMLTSICPSACMHAFESVKSILEHVCVAVAPPAERWCVLEGRCIASLPELLLKSMVLPSCMLMQSLL